MFTRTVEILLLFIILGCSQEVKQEAPKNQTYTLSIEKTEILPVLDIVNCPISPNISSGAKVPPIYKSNNLRRRIGYATYAHGDFVRINGILTDRNCTPISNATVQIWQPDANGIYKNVPDYGYLYDNLMYTEQKTRFKEYFDNSVIADENFTGSGSTTTDNLGRFSFLTIMPGGIEPLINLRVIYKHSPEFNTILYFKKTDKEGVVLEKIGKNIVDDVNEVVYKHQLTLLDVSQQRTY